MPRVGAIILAAGESSRLGQPKQLLEFRGQTLIQCAIDAALKSICKPVVVVLGANANLIEPQISERVRIVRNPEWEEGMASSIRCGVQEIAPEVDAVILILCDQPLVDSETLNRLAQHANGDLAAAEYNGTIGVPALFGRAHIGELLALRGKEGAKKILLAHEPNVIRIACPEAAVDVDSASDVQRLQRFE
jgi:molybdenum cofactor cytidylyltransferase